MSRIGKLPIKIPTTVDVTNENSILKVEGKFGTLERIIPETIAVEQTDGKLIVSLRNETRANKALHGLYRTLINNMLVGVSEQFLITLILQGVGYRASVQGKSLILNLGFSHPVNINIPDGITVDVAQNTTINIKACDKEQLGLFAAKVRSWRPPEPSIDGLIIILQAPLLPVTPCGMLNDFVIGIFIKFFLPFVFAFLKALTTSPALPTPTPT